MMIRTSILGLVLFAMACGGTTRNAALKNRVADERLAPLSLQDRAQEAEAHQGVFLAEWQLAFTQSQLEGAELEVKIATNDLASAKLGMKSAGLEKASADESGDVNKMSEMTQAAVAAQMEMEVHNIAITRAKKSLAYLKKRLVYEQALFRSLEAKLEYSRAESLNAAGIVPPDFKLATYKSQYADRQAQAKTYKTASDAEEKELKIIDAQLAKAKLGADAAKNKKPIPNTGPVEVMPDLPPDPNKPKVTPTQTPPPDETEPDETEEEESDADEAPPVAPLKKPAASSPTETRPAPKAPTKGDQS